MSRSLVRSRTGSILQFSVAADEFLCQKAFLPHQVEMSGQATDRGEMASFNLAGDGKQRHHQAWTATTTWEQTPGSWWAVKLTLTQVKSKIMKAVDFEGSLCRFLQHNFPAISDNRLLCYENTHTAAFVQMFMVVMETLQWHTSRWNFSDLPPQH